MLKPSYEIIGSRKTSVLFEGDRQVNAFLAIVARGAPTRWRITKKPFPISEGLVPRVYREIMPHGT